MELKQPSDELNAEIIALEKEQQLRAQVEAAGAAINELAARMQGLALVIHRQGLELNVLEGVNSPPRYTAGNLSLPEFRTQGRNYSLVSQPISLAQYKDAPALTEIIGSEPVAKEKQAFNNLEKERLLAASELAKSERRLHLASLSADKHALHELGNIVGEKRAKLQQITDELKQIKV